MKLIMAAGQSLVEPIMAAGTTNVPVCAALTLRCTATGGVVSPRLHIHMVCGRLSGSIDVSYARLAMSIVITTMNPAPKRAVPSECQ